ncbi:MAG: hypothetical protein WBK43_04245 [Prolixibacteraceae bacterium]|nr:hypothetical protein [Prolixibacteraceae bacterium]MDI9562771.1 hypothetical protein [Bacteroidota bacterium]NLS99716.1 hypothetical protein [Bacteroidales bacterium]OQB81773.1 MAG: hypothetical protein BWX87_00459 [Bacteroidetes bacterium ADurb.Bin123]HNZ67779.1 hypothetical protein [Prolixibacteraceae bacterium]
MKTKVLLVLLSVVLLVSCNRKPAPAGKDSDHASEAGSKGRYALKSGIVDYKSTMMGFDATQTLYFDDYGNKEVTESYMDIMGTKTTNVMLSKDGTMYNFDPENKTGMKSPAMPQMNQLNFGALTDEVIKEWNLKEEGTETFLDKECTKYSMNNTSLNMKGYYWVWKGIVLKMDLEMATSGMVMEATNIQENAEVPAEKFEIPADIVFQ